MTKCDECGQGLASSGIPAIDVIETRWDYSREMQYAITYVQRIKGSDWKNVKGLDMCPQCAAKHIITLLEPIAKGNPPTRGLFSDISAG